MTMEASWDMAPLINLGRAPAQRAQTSLRGGATASPALPAKPSCLSPVAGLIALQRLGRDCHRQLWND